VNEYHELIRNACFKSTVIKGSVTAVAISISKHESYPPSQEPSQDRNHIPF
jgi:hypothetical protein